MQSPARAEEHALLRARQDARRRAAEELRATRVRLAGGSPVNPEFDDELLGIFARNELGAAVTMPALAIIFSLASMFWAPHGQACLWLVLAIGAKVVLLDLCRRFVAAPRGELTRAWRRRLVTAELINGFTWAGFALVGVGAQTTENALCSSHVFIFATLIVLLAIRMTFAATAMAILYAGTIPMTVA